MWPQVASLCSTYLLRNKWRTSQRSRSVHLSSKSSGTAYSVGNHSLKVKRGSVVFCGLYSTVLIDIFLTSTSNVPQMSLSDHSVITPWYCCLRYFYACNMTRVHSQSSRVYALMAYVHHHRTIFIISPPVIDLKHSYFATFGTIDVHVN